MSSIRGAATVAGQDIWTPTETPQMDIGALMVDSQGRVLRYVRNDSTEIAAGAFCTAPEPITNHHGMAVNTAALGDPTVTVTLGSTAATLNDYEGGFLNVVNETGEGHSYEVLSHPAADSAATLVVTLKDPIKVAFAAATTVDLVHNDFQRIIIAATATTTPVGTAPIIIPASFYGFVVCNGKVATKAAATLTLGAELETGTSGDVDEMSDVTDPIVRTTVGYANSIAGVSGEHPLVTLRL